MQGRSGFVFESAAAAAAAAASAAATEAREPEAAALGTAARNGAVGRNLVPLPSSSARKGICAS